MEEKDLKAAPAPHIKDSISVQRIMYSVLIPLIPASVFGVYFFGLHALFVIIASILAALVTEFVGLRLMGRSFRMDGSAIITGLLLALTLPPTVPIWMPMIGAAFGIAIGKLAFGGLGNNIFNPALVGRLFLFGSWPAKMTSWVEPFDAVTTATPLAQWNAGSITASISDLFYGSVGGCIGETSALALLAGGSFLIIMGYIDWRTPLSIIGTVGILMWVLGEDPLFHILAGGLLLGAIFMATDYSTRPLTKKGRIIFGIGIGVLVVTIRMIGGYPEGVAFSILLMNGFVPLIDRFTKTRVYGTEKISLKNKIFGGS
ncbi:hypothetical protein AKJ53_01330 [candidate division MSBL1 archaeon SCGC-AAA382F02]|uniref:Ion-translocating oxidoreductase complex subunit D n=1 Tax=candidate division MSBL1 archaeon SCGC-AAA382F02 TaxID=1698282 RepID=A0A133VI46_9EURY|nr:hypothetical protein AKJ53_01330 [candidate division MSBL1 archaeon SCGC-AAA382F02]